MQLFGGKKKVFSGLFYHSSRWLLSYHSPSLYCISVPSTLRQKLQYVFKELVKGSRKGHVAINFKPSLLIWGYHNNLTLIPKHDRLWASTPQ